jgi:hypothetical protein
MMARQTDRVSLTAGGSTLTRQAAIDRAVVDVLDRSVTISAVVGGANQLEAAWRDARAKRAISPAVARFCGFASVERIRLIVLTLITAILVHIAMTGFSAPAPTPAVRAVWVTILIVLAAMLAGARHIANSWRDRSANGPGRENES